LILFNLAQTELFKSVNSLRREWKRGTRCNWVRRRS
jgi:hypothetical protein